MRPDEQNERLKSRLPVELTPQKIVEAKVEKERIIKETKNEKGVRLRGA